MSWTTEYPTKPGFYWIRNYRERRLAHYAIIPGPEVVEVRADIREGLAVYWIGGDEGWNQADFESAEWQGPIEPG